MPKKSKRESQKMRKKKISTAEHSADNPLANTVINIVDPGESSIDISAEERRKKEEAAKKLVMTPNIVAKEDQTFVQSKEEVQAIKKELKGDEIESEIDEFAILKPVSKNQKKDNEENVQTYVATTSIAIDNSETEKEAAPYTKLESGIGMTHDRQIADSLAVNIGSVNSGVENYSRQTTMESMESVNSSFSYFSDSNMVQRGDLSSPGLDHTWSQHSFTSHLEEAAVSGDSTTAVTQTIQSVVKTKKTSTRQIVSSESGVDDVPIETTMEAKDGNTEHVEAAKVIENVEIKKRSHISPDHGTAGDVFLEDLKEEILEDRDNTEAEKEKRVHVSPNLADEVDVFLEELKDDVLKVNKDNENKQQEKSDKEMFESVVEKPIENDNVSMESTKETKEEIKMHEETEELGKTGKRTHVSPVPGDANDIFLEGLKEEILDDKEGNENKATDKKVLQTRTSAWDNIIIKKEITLGLKKQDSHDNSTYSPTEDQWKDQLMEIKRKGVVLEERTLHTYFEEVETKVFDTELGYGLVSENKGQPKMKIVLKGNSPFLNNDMKTLHFRLSDLHLYSQVYRIMEATITQPGRTFYIFRHYLHLPSMTNEEVDSLKVAACENDNQDNIEFIEPLYIDDDFVVVEQKRFAWFLVVSEFPNLPVRVNFVPFMERGSGPSPIFICPLPRGRHHISKLLSENPDWKKCGYEEPSVMQKGLLYNFSTDVWGQKTSIGMMRIETWGHDTKWVVFKPEMFKPQNFIESTLTREGTNEFVFSGPLSLYDILRVDVEVPFYQKKVTSWEIATIDQAILADLPPYGRISNLEPFFAYVRAGRLSLSQLKAILTHLGYSDTPDTNTDVAEGKIATIVKNYLQDWKEKNGSQATLVEFLSVLRMADVALASIAMEIINNISNSNCGIAAYSIN